MVCMVIGNFSRARSDEVPIIFQDERIVTLSSQVLNSVRHIV